MSNLGATDVGRSIVALLFGYGGEGMNPEWHIRPYEPLSVAIEVVRSHPRADKIDFGDNVILRLKNDESGEDVCVRVTQFISGGRMAGVISRAYRMSARGDRKLAKGISVEFEETHVFRLEKAAQ
jgi:hypothetical protein